MALSSRPLFAFAGVLTLSGLLFTGGCASGDDAAPDKPAPKPITTGPLPDVGCDYTMVIKSSCAIAGCHNTQFHASDLDLTPDLNLRQRIVDVVASHREIDCGSNGVYMECIPATCPTTAKFVDRSNPAASWVLAKLNGTQNMCGTNMPQAPGDSATFGWGDPAKACLVTFFNALAANK